jgi:hypothetical protein
MLAGGRAVNGQCKASASYMDVRHIQPSCMLLAQAYERLLQATELQVRHPVGLAAQVQQDIKVTAETPSQPRGIPRACWQPASSTVVAGLSLTVSKTLSPSPYRLLTGAMSPLGPSAAWCSPSTALRPCHGLAAGGPGRRVAFQGAAFLGASGLAAAGLSAMAAGPGRWPRVAAA